MLTVAGIAALVVVAVAYILFVSWERQRIWVAAVGAGLVLLVRLVPVGDLAPTSFSGSGSVVEWNTIGLLFGLFLFAGVLQQVGFFSWVARKLVERTGAQPVRLLLAFSFLSFGLSAFLNSITVLLVLASLTLEVCRATGRDPVPILLAEISASNAGGAATFVGDPPNVILGTYFGLTFSDFILHTALPALAALGVILLVFGRNPHSPPLSDASIELPPATINRPRLVAGLAGFGGMLAVFSVQSLLGIPVWLVGVGGGVVAIGLAGRRNLRHLIRDLDWETLLFFLFLFILVGALTTTGDLASVARALASVGGANLILTGSLLLWSFGLLSAIVDNVPLAAAVAPLLAALGSDTGLPTAPLVYASALGTDIGGNGTPIGASANVVGLAVARRGGVHVSWSQYLRKAFPVMLLSLAAANAVWLFLR